VLLAEVTCGVPGWGMSRQVTYPQVLADKMGPRRLVRAVTAIGYVLFGR
jgi:hypothetical protein